jgi:hypothetical protein
MSTQPIIMIDPQTGNPGSVSPDKVADAQKAGYEPAVKMISDKGIPGYVAQSKVDAAKARGYVLHPDSFQRPMPGMRDDPMARGQLTTDDQVNAAAARVNANLNPQQRQALAFSDRAQDVAGTGMTIGAAAGGAALAAPVVAPILRSPLVKTAGGIAGGEAIWEYIRHKLTGGR